MALARGVAMRLATLGVVDYRDATGGGNAFVNQLPTMPDTAISFRDSGGPESDSKLGYDSPSLQVMARAVSQQTALDLMAAVYDELHGLRNTQLEDGTQLVYLLGVQSSPVSLGQDENSRFVFALNFRSETRNVTEHRQ